MKMKKKKNNDMKMTKSIMEELIRKRYKPSFSRKIGDFFEKFIIFITIIAVLSLTFIGIIFLIENPLSLMILFVGIALIILIRRKK